MRINNAPKYIRRRVLVAFWGSVLIAEAVWLWNLADAAVIAHFG